MSREPEKARELTQTTQPLAVISPRNIDAVIFDLDGVVTRTAAVHFAAWKDLFDDFLRQRADREGVEFKPFERSAYLKYVDGKPRYDGVRSFLASRNIELPEGESDDPPERQTICGLGNRKNGFFLERLERDGVQVYDSTVELIHQLRDAGIRTAIISSSKNCRAVLETAGLLDLFDARVDGTVTAELKLKGKPAPDIFLEAARRLGVKPARAVVVEDAIAGVQAGHRGGFHQVIGVDRADQSEDLSREGADFVVRDLSEVRVDSDTRLPSKDPSEPRPTCVSALDSKEEILNQLKGRRAAVFLDYDGTLTPIVRRPEDALLSGRVRETVKKLSRQCTVAVISGRGLGDVREKVAIESLFYAGSHGFEIGGPDGWHEDYQPALEFLPDLDQAEKELRHRFEDFTGVRVERKKFSVALHYRELQDKDSDEVRSLFHEVAGHCPRLHRSEGKKIFELRPDIDWNKGKALFRLLELFDLNHPDVLVFYFGDDTTDEDAFEAIRGRGIGILVTETRKPTAARYVLGDPGDVQEFLDVLRRHLEKAEK